jgi:hypothetical protein
MEPIIYQKNEFPLIEWYLDTGNDNVQNGLYNANMDNALFNLKEIKRSNISNISVHISDEQTLSRFIAAYQHAENINMILNIPLVLVNKYFGYAIDTKVKLNIIFSFDTEIAAPMNEFIQFMEDAEYRNKIMEHVDSFLLTFGKDQMDNAFNSAVKIHNFTKKKVILSPYITIHTDDHKINWQQLDSYYTKVLNELKQLELYKMILIKRGILPLSLLVEHPCNAYMCTGRSCHSDKGDNPRKLIIDPCGDVYPISSKIPDLYKYGNIYNQTWNNLFSGTLFTEKHNLFKQTCKSVYFKWIQHCPFKIVPWEDLFEHEAKKATL